MKKSKTSNVIAANKCVQHFSKLLQRKNVGDQNLEYIPKRYSRNRKQNMLDSHFPNEEISNGIKKLKNNKANELDSINKEVIKADALAI